MKFQKGQSGNPAGRRVDPAKAHIQALAREHTPKALRALVDSLKNAATRVAAAKEILDRGWGKAVQGIEHSGKIDTRAIIVDSDEPD